MEKLVLNLNLVLNERMRKVRNFVLFLILVAVFMFAFVCYYCEIDAGGSACPIIGFGHSRHLYGLPSKSMQSDQNIKSSVDSIPARALNSAIGYNDDAVPHTVDFKKERFNTNGDDVFVFLHIQKTGGTTFGRHLVRNMRMDPPCTCFKGRKKCKCVTQNKHIWLFSRFSTGWTCGLHADWTELKECVSNRLDKIEGEKRQRRYLYITILRDPIRRYLSEWRHVSRGATWKNAALKCNGRRATLEEVPRCFQGDDWYGVSLDDFMKCPHNLANNRQTRMTANLSQVGCYNKSSMSEQQRETTLLRSAKDNLKNMAFIGFTENQLCTQYLFERTFGLQFGEDFIQVNLSYADTVKLSPEQEITLDKLNLLDIKLYNYAKTLFSDRLRAALLNDSRVIERMRRAGFTKPETETTETILQHVKMDDLTTGRAPDPNAYWDPNLDTTSR